MRKFSGRELASYFFLFFYAFSNTALLAVSIMRMRPFWSEGQDEPSTLDYWISILLTLPVLYANFMCSCKEQEAAVIVRNSATHQLVDDIKKGGMALIKTAGPVAGVYHILNKTPPYCNIPLSFLSVLGGAYMFYSLFKRSDHLVSLETREQKKWLPLYLAFGFSSSDFILQYSALLATGTEFQEGVIHPARDAANAVIFTLITGCQLFLFIQNMISFKNRIKGLPSFAINKGAVLAHYCSAVVTLSVINSFLAIPAQLSDEHLTHKQSALIGAVPALICLPGLYGCVYSFYGNKQLENRISNSEESNTGLVSGKRNIRYFRHNGSVNSQG